MYSVSQDYIDAMHGAVTRAYLTFTIDSVSYTEQNILKGSFNISNQCTGTNDVTIGAVYVGVLNATLRNVNISRQSWRGKQIIPTYHFLVDEENDTWETVPLGIFTISQAEWKATGISVRAYDNMALLDKPYFISDAEGELYDFLSMAADACGITLAQSQAQIEALPNGDVTFSFNSETGVETWRDIVSCIAQIVGGFATINRSGELEIRAYGQTECDSLDTTGRHTGGYFSDYKTKYTSFSVVFVETKETRTYSQPENDGLVMALGTNPFLQDENIVQTIAQDLLDSIANIQYVPYKIAMASNPIYDLGDVIEFTDGLAGTASLCCVQKYEFYLHKNMKLSGYGSDPSAQDAKSKTQKQIVSLQSGIAQTAEQTLDFILPSTLSQSDIADNSSNTAEIFDFTASIENGKIDFFTCVQFDAETTVSAGSYADLVVTVTLTMDGATIATIVQSYRDGNQVFTINHLIENVIKGNHTLVVTIGAAGGSLSSIQFVAAYLLTAKSTGSGSATQKILFANGHWANNILMDGLDANKMTEYALDQGIENTIIKYNISPTTTSPSGSISGLSQYFLSSYLLCTESYYAEPFYTVNGYYRKKGERGSSISPTGKPIGDTNVLFWIPVKRITGFNTLQFLGKIIQNNGHYSGIEDFNQLAMGAGAVVNGVMQYRLSAFASGVNDWTTYTVDISALPYVDYIMLFGCDGSPAFKDIKLLRS